MLTDKTDSSLMVKCWPVSWKLVEKQQKMMLLGVNNNINQDI
jgi:hypothetical protein